MAETSELQIIRDQYELAFYALSRGLTAEEAGKKVEALNYYTKGRQHLIRGLGVPTGGQKRVGAVWDRARHLQQRMSDTLGTVSTHISDLETSGVTTRYQRGRLLMDLPPKPDLSLNGHRSCHQLYPSIPPPTQNTAPSQNTPPRRPVRPAAPHRQIPTAAASGTLAMATPGDQPPAYTPQPTDGHRSLAYGLAAGNLWSGAAAAEAVGADQNELLFIPSGVQMFFVAPNGEVSSLSYPGFLRIITCKHQSKDFTAQRPSAFLHVCDQLYPLTPDSPVLLANSGIFMFPDTSEKTPGSYVGLVLSSELPAADREMFHDLLEQLVDLRIQGPEGADVMNLSTKVPLGSQKEKTELTVPPAGMEKPPLPGWSEKMGQGILSGSTRLSQKLVQGAEATGRAITKGGGKIRENLTPQETPSEVSPQVTRGLQTTQQVTGGAVRVSQFLVNGLSTVIGQVAEKVGPHVKKHGAKLVPESMKKSQDGRPSNLKGAKFVAVSSVKGLSAIWSGLESGAKLVCKSVSTETVTTVKHKYGNQAGQATDTALHSAANVAVAAYNIDNLGTLAIINAAERKASKTTAESSDGQPKTDRRSEEKKGE